jgi:hypothetical protein
MEGEDCSTTSEHNSRRSLNKSMKSIALTSTDCKFASGIGRKIIKLHGKHKLSQVGIPVKT